MRSALALPLLFACQAPETPLDQEGLSLIKEVVAREVSIGQAAAHEHAQETVENQNIVASQVQKNNTQMTYLLSLPKIKAWAETYVVQVQTACEDAELRQESPCTQYYDPHDPIVATVAGSKAWLFLEDKAGDPLSNTWEYAISMPIEHQTCTVAWTVEQTSADQQNSLSIHCLGEEFYSQTQKMSLNSMDPTPPHKAEESRPGTPMERELFDFMFANEQTDTATNE